MSPLVITGTDTGIGKTVFAAGLSAALGASYWKPVQAGLEDATDREEVARLAGVPVLPEAYRLARPASPHLAAEDMGLEIDLADLTLPEVSGPLVVEGAGGVMVPLTRKHYFLDVFAVWDAPVVLVARTALGTINYSILSLMALRGAGCSVVGVAFVGDPEPEVETTICEMGNVRHLGRVPKLPVLTRASLAQAFTDIDLATIRSFL